MHALAEKQYQFGHRMNAQIKSRQNPLSSPLDLDVCKFGIKHQSDVMRLPVVCKNDRIRIYLWATTMAMSQSLNSV